MTSSTVRRIDFSDVFLYAVTPDFKDPAAILPKITAALRGGVDALQLRSKSLTDRAFLELGKEVKLKCAEAGALFIVDNRADIAIALNADGVHVGHEDMPVSFVRDWVGHRRIVGVSTHSVPEAIEAQKAGADYVSCGPLWPTPTKPDYKPVGLGLIGFYKAALRVPFVAIGAIDMNNLDQVLNAGAQRVAVVRQIFDAADPAAAAKKFKEKLKGGSHAA